MEKRKKRLEGFSWFDIVNYGLLTIFAITVLYPFWDQILLSFSSPQDATSLGINLWNKKWHLDSYRYIFSDARVGYAYLNTIFRTVVGTFMSVAFCIMAAYPLSQTNLPGRSAITIYFLICMFFSGGLIPTYLLIRKLNLINNRMVLILPGLVSVYNVVIMRNYMMTIDKSLEESAFIDGAGYATILVKIIIPLCKPVIATIVLWTAVGHWNAWFDAMIYMRGDDKIVLQLLLRQMLELAFAESDTLEAYNRLEKTQVIGATARAAITIVTIGPIVILYPFVQKYFIEGIMVGSLKG